LPITIDDEHGPVDFYAIPYLQPELVRHLPWVPQGARTQHQVIDAAMAVVRNAIAMAARRSVVVAHTFVAGVESVSSDSERAITKSPTVVGGVDAVPVASFDGPDYVALGHLHVRAELAANVRYPGAPLHYSFKEADAPRGCWVVDIGRGGVEQIEWADLPVPRPLKEIQGPLSSLLTEARWTPFERHYVRAVYTDANTQLEPMQRLRTRFEFCAEVVHAPAGRVEAVTSYAQKVRGKSDREIADSFLFDVRNGDGPTAAEAAILDEVISQRDKEVLVK
jgi:exonuclease SbcD